MVTSLLESLTAWVAQTRKPIFDTNKGQGPSLSSAVTVVNYSELKPSLMDLVGQYHSVLTFPRKPLGVTDRRVHNIRLKSDTKPVSIPAYRLPHSQMIDVDNIVNDMLEQGVIQDSHSPWNSPLFLVPPKNGTFRVVIDFYCVKAVKLDEHYPLPVLSDFIMSMGRGNSIFSNLDLLSGYWQHGLPSASLFFLFFHPLFMGLDLGGLHVCCRKGGMVDSPYSPWLSLTVLHHCFDPTWPPLSFLFFFFFISTYCSRTQIWVASMWAAASL